MDHRSIAVWTTAGLIFIMVVLLRLFAADELGYGPWDAEAFADRAYGVEVNGDVSPFFLMWTRSDGQAFYSIAGDLNGDEQARGLATQSYRMSRIGMSIAARALTLGNEGWLVYTLPIVTLLAYGGLVSASARLVDRLGPRALLLPLTPAAVVGTIYDSAEALGTLLLVVSLTASTALFATIAGMLLGASRPSYAIGLPANRHGILPAAAALATGGLLQVLFVFGWNIPFTAGAGNLGPPLLGLVREWANMGSVSRFVAVVVMATSVALALLAVSKTFKREFRWACGLNALFSLCLAEPVYQEMFSPLRATAPALILIILAPLFARSAAPPSEG